MLRATNTGYASGSRYANHDEARRDIADYIVGFYNTVRIHSSLGYLPSSIYERQTAAEPPIAVSVDHHPTVCYAIACVLKR